MNRHALRISILIFSFVVSACGAQIAKMHGIDIIDPYDPKAVEAATKIERDQHTGLTKVVGPLIFHDKNILGKSYFLRGWKSNGKNTNANSIQIYVSASFDEWAFLDSAFSNGKQLKTSQIDRKVGYCSGYSGCTVHEVVGINIDENQLNEAAKSGLSFKVLGKRQSIVMTIPAGYFSGFLAVYQKAH